VVLILWHKKFSYIAGFRGLWLQHVIIAKEFNAASGGCSKICGNVRPL